MSYKENRLLQLLIEQQGCEVSIEKIIIFVWGEDKDYNIGIDSVKSQISHLRKKLPPNIIHTVYGGGYLLSI